MYCNTVVATWLIVVTRSTRLTWVAYLLYLNDHRLLIKFKKFDSKRHKFVTAGPAERNGNTEPHAGTTPRWWVPTCSTLLDVARSGTCSRWQIQVGMKTKESFRHGR